jgi:hypothetical protein
MHELYIEPIVFCRDVVDGKALPSDHLARLFAASLPGWHPVKRLFTGEAQLLGANGNVCGFFLLFNEVFGQQLEAAAAKGAYAGSSGMNREEIAAAPDAFGPFLPADVIYKGRLYSFRILHANARDAVGILTRQMPPLRTILLDAFDRTVAKLVRAIRVSDAPEPPVHATLSLVPSP